MATPTPFFELPYPNPPVLYNDLPQDIRDTWVGFARANKISWLDYRKEIRQTDDAYFMLNTTELLRTSGSTGLYYPPGLLTPNHRPLDNRLASVSIADHLAFRLARHLDTETTLAVWATATSPTTAGVNSRANRFLGTVTLPAGSTRNTTTPDLGANYVAQFATLAGDLGDALALWVFLLDQGQLIYLAGIATRVVELSFLGCEFYWPLNESAGLRHSIAQPATLTPHNLPAQVTGPIDSATLLTRASGQYLSTNSGSIASPGQSNFTFALWINFTSLSTFQTIATRGDWLGSNASEWSLRFLETTNNISVAINNGFGESTTGFPNLGTPTTSTWLHLAFTYDAATTELATYSNGTPDDSNNANRSIQTLETPFTLGSENTPGRYLDAAIADAAFFRRRLSAAEIAALYNSGAGLRYPYQ